jgi:menaquinone-dependent protoporphyrinogen oxidase
MKILVAYASKTGFTKGIAEFIGERLASRGLQAEVKDVEDVNDMAGYDAFVVGSAVYMFHWMKGAERLVTHNGELLRDHPVWLFSSGPVGTSRTDAKGRDLLEVSGPSEIDELREAAGPRDHRVFFGGLDGSKLKGTTGLFYRMAARSKTARESMPEGDFRDWKEIGSWADSIAATLLISPR